MVVAHSMPCGLALRLLVLLPHRFLVQTLNDHATLHVAHKVYLTRRAG